MGMLERGGNSFDAAVATAFTLQVVEPHLNGPGGDVPLIVHDVRRGRTEVICGQGPAPARATIAHFRALGLDLVPGTGLLAACIPGTFDSYMMLLRDYGTMRLADVLTPAIAYARNGYPLVERAVATIGTVEATCSPTRRSPTPMSASCARPRAPAATATSRSSAPARPGRRASSPRRSTASAARKR
jgi:gamma-glutamyltranspeptidase / glutathione hydrolase